MVGVVVVVIVFNESEYIEYALRSVYNWMMCEKIIVIEGAVELCKQYANSDGSSTDETVDLLRTFPDHDNKIVLHRGSWKDKIAQRQQYMRIIHELKLSNRYVLQVDGDEVYSAATLFELQKVINRNQADVVYIPFLHFWTSFKWVAVGGIWDSPQLRCFKCRSDFSYTQSHIYPTDKQKGKVLAGNKRYTHSTLRSPIHHYAYVKNAEAIRRKLEFYTQRDGERLAIVDNWTGWAPGRPTSCTHPGKTAAKAYEAFHPAAMINHPYRHIDDIRIM